MRRGGSARWRDHAEGGYLLPLLPLFDPPLLPLPTFPPPPRFRFALGDPPLAATPPGFPPADFCAMSNLLSTGQTRWADRRAPGQFQANSATCRWRPGNPYLGQEQSTGAGVNRQARLI